MYLSSLCFEDLETVISLSFFFLLTFETDGVVACENGDLRIVLSVGSLF